MRSKYIEQLSLLLSVLPSISIEQVFALKGGTAINLFYRDMPRLSVDIDLTYILVKDRERLLYEIDASLDRIVQTIAWRTPELTTERNPATGRTHTRVLVRNQRVGIKIETSPVSRGTVHPPQRMAVTESVEKQFGFAEANVVVFDEVYAGTIVAALDRQHPRDLFDIKILYDNEGITDSLFSMFLVYLAGSSRPMHEVLAPNVRFEETEIDRDFAGMTVKSIATKTLVETQVRLHNDIRSRLTGNSARFLLTLHDAEPDFGLIRISGLYELPAIKWKIQNLQRLKDQDPHKHALQREALVALFQ